MMVVFGGAPSALAYFTFIAVCSCLVAQVSSQGLDLEAISLVLSGLRQPAKLGQDGHDAVADLTDDSYTDFTKAGSNVLVLYYAPWCFWSNELMPSFFKAAESLLNHKPEIKFARIDVSTNAKIREQEEVTRFPTLKLVTPNYVRPYDGGRSQTNIVKWVTDALRSETTINSIEQLNDLLSAHAHEVIVIGAFPPNTEHITTTEGEMMLDDASATASAATFLDVSRRFPHTLFMDVSNATISSEVIRRFNLTSDFTEPPFVVLVNPYNELYSHIPDSEGIFTVLKDHEPAAVAYHGSLTDTTELRKFITLHRLPAIVPLTANLVDEVADDRRPFFLLFLDPKDPKAPSYVKALKRPSIAYRSHLLFVVCFQPGGFIDTRLEHMADASEDLRPLYRIFEPGFGNGKKYLPPADTEQIVTTKTVGDFAEKYTKNKLKPHLKSEDPLSEDLNNGPVRVLVGSTYEQEVKQSNKDVLVVFHAPWCGHCRKLEPILHEVGVKLAEFPHILIAKLDATANEIEGVMISGYPSLLFFGMNKKDTPELFDGQRSVLGIVSWLATKTHIPFDVDRVMSKAGHQEVGFFEDGPSMLFDQEL